MTSSLAELQRKVRQNDNDIQAIYEMLSTIAGTQKRHTNRLDEIDSQLEGMDTKLDQILNLLDRREKL